MGDEIGDERESAEADGNGANGGKDGAETEAVATETAARNETATDTSAIGEENLDREQLWDMEELVVAGEFDYFARMFGQGGEGNVYVLASRRGVPAGDTGAVLQIGPPEEGEAVTETAQTETAAETAETASAGVTETAVETTSGD